MGGKNVVNNGWAVVVSLVLLSLSYIKNEKFRRKHFRADFAISDEKLSDTFYNSKMFEICYFLSFF